MPKVDAPRTSQEYAQAQTREARLRAISLREVEVKELEKKLREAGRQAEEADARFQARKTEAREGVARGVEATRRHVEQVLARVRGRVADPACQAHYRALRRCCDQEETP